MKKFIICFLIALISLNISCLYAAKKEKSKKQVYYIAEKDLPRRIAIFPPFFVKKISSQSYVSQLIRGVIQNYLVGKGFVSLPFASVDAKLGKEISFKKFSLKEAFKKLPEADGIVTINVYKLSRVNIAFIEYYKVDAELCLYSRNKNKKLGCWRETATRKKVALAADPLGAIATVVSSAITSAGDIHIKNVIFEWAFKVSSLIPGFSEAMKRPKILRVVTNITSEPFKLGDKILVGIEGDAGLNASFDLGEFKKGINMSEIEPGIYKGVYVVQEGDNLKNGILVVHLTRPDGQRRDWIETSPFITIDGCPPKIPRNLTAEIRQKAIKLNWHTDDAETIAFLILRSNNPLTDYKEIAKVKEFTYEDKDIEPGKNYFYRVIALDDAGNQSKPLQYGPISLPVLTEQTLPKTLSGTYLSGKYLLEKTATVPLGVNAKIGPDVIITCSKEASIIVEGELLLKETIFKPQTDNWIGIEVAPTGKLIVEDSTISGAKNALLIKGKASCTNLTIEKGNIGLIIDSNHKVEVKKSSFINLHPAISIQEGEVEITECKFKENEVAIEILSGQPHISKNNFWQNKVNIKSNIPLTLKANYFGTEEPGNFLLIGKIEVKSFLNAPYPQGEEKELDPKKLEKLAESLREKGINALNKGNYGQAYELLEKSLKTWPQKDTYIYLIYTLSALGEDVKLKQIIEEALNKYPYETKIYQISVRYYLQTNQKEEAKRLLKKGLKLNPNNPSLEAMLPLVQGKEE